MKLEKGHRARAFELHGATFEGESGTQLYGECPFCRKSGKLYVHKTKLLWDCKSCGVSGNLHGFLEEVAKRNEKKFWASERARAKLSRDRALPEEAFEGWGLGYDGLKYTIPVYDADGDLVDLRHYRFSRKGVRSTNGCHSGLLGIQKIRSSHPNTPIFIAEGEWDAIALGYLFRRSKRSYLVTGVPGASTFKDVWVQSFDNRDVFLCYDNDDAGAEGETKTYSRLQQTARSLHVLRYEPEAPIGYDLRDYVSKWIIERKPRKGARLLMDLFVSDPRGEVSEIVPTDTDRPSAYSRPISFEKVSEVFRKWLYLKDTDGVKISLAVVMSNLIDGDPIWMFLVAPPGGAKTETVNAFSKCASVYSTSSITAHSLISGMNWKNGQDPSLIPKLDGRVLCVKDFTSILTLRDNEKDEIFGILRDAYDGRCGKVFGNGIVRNYTSRFSILAAVTPTIYSEGSKHTSLGERFLKFALADNLEHFSEAEIIAKAISNVNEETDMRFELADAIQAFMQAPLERVPIIPGNFLEKIVELAKFGSRVRATVQRDRFRPDIVESRPSAEVGARLGKQLAKMAISLAAVERRKAVTAFEIELLKKIVIDTVPQRAEDIIRTLWRRCPDVDDSLSTKEVAEHTEYPLATITRLLQNFLLLKVVVRHGTRNKNRWQLSDYVRSCIERSAIYDGPGTADRDRLRYHRKRRKSVRKQDTSRR